MKRIYYLLILVLIGAPMWSQTTDKQRNLERKKEQILTEIKAVQQLLKTEQTKERNVLSEIQEQNHKIKLSQDLIRNVQQQISLLTRDVQKNQAEVAVLEKELKALKDDYAKTIVKSYKSRSSQSRIMFVLSSENFAQAYKRIQYMKQYANYRKKQGDEVREKSEALAVVIKSLEQKKVKQSALLTEAEVQKKNLEVERTKQQGLMALIQKDQRKYNDQIKKKRSETAAIDKQIQQMIREAIAEANRKAREAAAKAAAKTGEKVATPSKSSTNTAVFELTPEGKVVANSFKANQGRLPWPVSKGYISLRYGDQPHPIQKHLTIHNSGVEISTVVGTRARSVFQGEVLQVQVLSGNNKAVLIQHGDYITVYQNLSDVYVKKGDKVTLKQEIGVVNTNASGQTVLKFLLSHNTTIHNPQTWLSGSN